MNLDKLALESYLAHQEHMMKLTDKLISRMEKQIRPNEIVPELDSLKNIYQQLRDDPDRFVNTANDVFAVRVHHLTHLSVEAVNVYYAYENRRLREQPMFTPPLPPANWLQRFLAKYF